MKQTNIGMKQSYLLETSKQMNEQTNKNPITKKSLLWLQSNCPSNSILPYAVKFLKRNTSMQSLWFLIFPCALSLLAQDFTPTIPLKQFFPRQSTIPNCQIQWYILLLSTQFDIVDGAFLLKIVHFLFFWNASFFYLFLHLSVQSVP